ncbi:hypothetical protein HPG69_004194 [Diceros bicornis minor]|uniref:DUF4195 domain-containing protein n=1 Tax=Diceros bicornis minor TaxID=77932 RepID=A0A7J7EA07_DICBM|nr:hypothetical protein HPG69_004194 [Diceros bicornis minor]
MGDNPFQSKNNTKMAKLFMECEVGELELWQKKPTGQGYVNPTSNPMAASPVNFHLESRSSHGSVGGQPLSKPVSLSETTQSAQGYIG